MTATTDPAAHAAAHDPAAVALGRRGLFRRGAVVAAGAGLLVAAAPGVARAADGDPLALGQTNSAGSTTTLQLGDVDAGSPDVVLSLRNAEGPALQLQALDESWDEPLEVGQIANRTTGPIIGVDQGTGPLNTYVALGTDLQSIPIPYAVDPVRVVDTRSRSLRDNIVATSTNAFSTSLRLRAGQWFDVAVLAADDAVSIEGIWANITTTGPLAGGFLTAYAPGRRPGVSSVNFAKGQSIANGGYFRPGVAQGHYALRIYSSAETHILIDVTGLALVQQPGPLASAAQRRRNATRRPRAQRSRLVGSLGRR